MVPRKYGKECSEFLQTRARRTRGARSGDSGFQRSSAKYPRAGPQEDRSRRSRAAGRQESPNIATVNQLLSKAIHLSTICFKRRLFTLRSHHTQRSVKKKNFKKKNLCSSSWCDNTEKLSFKGVGGLILKGMGLWPSVKKKKKKRKRWANVSLGLYSFHL